MSAVSRKRGLVWLVPAILIVALPLAAYLGAETWLSRSLQTHVDLRATVILERMENAIARATLSLREAQTKKIDDCSAEDREALRLLVFESPVLKEIAVVGPGGGIRCNNIGSLVQITPASTPFVTRSMLVRLPRSAREKVSPLVVFFHHGSAACAACSYSCARRPSLRQSTAAA